MAQYDAKAIDPHRARRSRLFRPDPGEPHPEDLRWGREAHDGADGGEPEGCEGGSYHRPRSLPGRASGSRSPGV